MLFAPSRLTTNVTVALPEAVCSAFVIGLGASLLGFNWAVNVTVSPGAVGLVVESDLQPAATNARTISKDAYFIG
jgi:hypothetical protein